MEQMYIYCLVVNKPMTTMMLCYQLKNMKSQVFLRKFVSIETTDG
jgi:hypothetical protein